VSSIIAVFTVQFSLGCMQQANWLLERAIALRESASATCTSANIYLVPSIKDRDVRADGGGSTNCQMWATAEGRSAINRTPKKNYPVPSDPPPVHRRLDSNIFCFGRFYARYNPDVLWGGGVFQTDYIVQGGRGCPKCQLLLGRPWWMTPWIIEFKTLDGVGRGHYKLHNIVNL